MNNRDGRISQPFSEATLPENYESNEKTSPEAVLNSELVIAYKDGLERDIFSKARAEVIHDIAENYPEAELDNLAINKATHELIATDYDRFKIICVEQNGELLQANAELRVKTAHLEQMLEIDALTEVANRKKAEKVFEASKKHPDFLSGKSVLVVVRLDLDGFKSINEEGGHQAGDEALKKVAKSTESLLKSTESLLNGLRATDCVARIGGDEFVLIIMINKPTDKKNTIASIAEMVTKKAIEKIEAIKLQDGKSLTASSGFKIIDKDNALDFQSADKMADNAAGISKQCKFIKNLQKGSIRIINSDTTVEQFLAQNKIDPKEFLRSAIAAQVGRLADELFKGKVPPAEARDLLDKLLVIATQNRLEETKII